MNGTRARRRAAAVLVAVALVLATAACGAAGSEAPGQAQSEQALRDYFTHDAAWVLDGMQITKVAFFRADGGQRLDLEFTSDQTPEAIGTALDWLVIGGTGGGWIGDLNQRGLDLVQVDIRVTYTSAQDDFLAGIDVAKHGARWSGPGEDEVGPRPYTTTSAR